MNHNTRPLALALLLPLLVAACAETVTPDAPESDADAAPVSNAAPITDAAPMTDAALADAAPADAAPDVGRRTLPRLTAEVDLSQAGEGLGISSPQFGAWVRETPQNPLATGCETSAVGPCQVQYCPPGVEHRPRSTVTPGEVTVDGLGRGQLSLSNRSSLDPYRSSRFWSGGEAIRVEGAGVPGLVPPFHLEVTAPGLLTVTAPQVDGVALDRGAGFDFAWQPTRGLVRILVFQEGSDGSAVNTGCDFPAVEGRATVPRAALSIARNPTFTHAAVMSTATARATTDDLDVTLRLDYVQRWFDLAFR